MTNSYFYKIATACVFIGLGACASNPNDIDRAYVSPLKYQSYDCNQIATEMDYVGNRTNKLYERLKSERTKDNWQMGVGLVLFWPSLFFLEGGDGPEAAEYSQLKGEFEALRQNSTTKSCRINSLSPSQIIEISEAEQKKTAVSAVDKKGAIYGAKVKEIAEQQGCRKAISLQSVTAESESWALACADNSEMSIRGFDGECYVKQ